MIDSKFVLLFCIFTLIHQSVCLVEKDSVLHQLHRYYNDERSGMHKFSAIIVSIVAGVLCFLGLMYYFKWRRDGSVNIPFLGNRTQQPQVPVNAGYQAGHQPAYQQGHQQQAYNPPYQPAVYQQAAPTNTYGQDAYGRNPYGNAEYTPTGQYGKQVTNDQTYPNIWFLLIHLFYSILFVLLYQVDIHREIAWLIDHVHRDRGWLGGDRMGREL